MFYLVGHIDSENDTKCMAIEVNSRMDKRNKQAFMESMCRRAVRTFQCEVAEVLYVVNNQVQMISKLDKYFEDPNMRYTHVELSIPVEKDVLLVNIPIVDENSLKKSV